MIEIAGLIGIPKNKNNRIFYLVCNGSKYQRARRSRKTIDSYGLDSLAVKCLRQRLQLRLLGIVG